MFLLEGTEVWVIFHILVQPDVINERHTLHGGEEVTRGEVNTWYRDIMSEKPENIYYWGHI